MNLCFSQNGRLQPWIAGQNYRSAAAKWNGAFLFHWSMLGTADQQGASLHVTTQPVTRPFYVDVEAVIAWLCPQSYCRSMTVQVNWLDLCQVRTQTEMSEGDLMSTTSEKCFLNVTMNSTLAFEEKVLSERYLVLHMCLYTIISIVLERKLAEDVLEMFMYWKVGIGLIWLWNHCNGNYCLLWFLLPHHLFPENIWVLKQLPTHRNSHAWRKMWLN